MNQPPEHNLLPNVDPAPVPTALLVGQAETPDGRSHVLLVVRTPLGQQHYFLDPDTASTVANGLERAAMAARAGLVIPS